MFWSAGLVKTSVSKRYVGAPGCRDELIANCRVRRSSEKKKKCVLLIVWIDPFASVTQG